MCKVKTLLIVLFITNYFSHATTENYEKQFPDEEEKENINKFIEEETKSFLDKLNTKREEENKDQITMKQIRDDTQVKKESEILIDILNNFSTTLKDQNENRGEIIEYIEIDEKTYCYKLKIEAEKGIIFTSDTHADADTVEKIWYFFDQLKKQGKIDKLVLLGDYGDRGKYWTYTYFLLAAMAAKYGENIIFIRGNHEDMLTMKSYEALCAIDDNNECTNNCWNEMPLICDITWHQKKIFCSHGAMPLNENGEWGQKTTNDGLYFLANWNDNIFINDPPSGIKNSHRGAGYEIPIEEIFENMKTLEYDYSIHGHIHKNQCGILTTGKKPKRVITVVANEFYYKNDPNSPFLPAVYIINDENQNGTFFNLLQKPNEKIKELNKEKPKNMEVLNNCVIYEYDFELQKTNDKIKKLNKENQTKKEEQNEKDTKSEEEKKQGGCCPCGDCF